MSFLPPLDFSQSPSKSSTTKYSPGLPPEPAINDDDADDDSSFETISTISYSPRPSNDGEHAKLSASVHRLGHADSALGQLGEDADEDENVEVESVSSGTSGPCVEMASVVSARNTVGGRRKLVKKGSITATRGGGDMRSFRVSSNPPCKLPPRPRKLIRWQLSARSTPQRSYARIKEASPSPPWKTTSKPPS
ncbi:hypothetical protein Tdes44962_MAKER07650 [Teratosphaeria destructans]|uniref:Uncharacterized protein n=1 Tax=Teratosphaeria destructans TaxID=418781 RepID=A0A9W7W605_9PEZI|nr:hypothetical protein Tdes44962_MAKER07650 [Teratosphaeria destructans]